jgi:hypothetical protein
MCRRLDVDQGRRKIPVELSEGTCLIWHKEVTHSSIFNSGLALVSTYRGLQTNKKLECWVPYGLKLHKDWNRVMEDSVNRFRSKMNCKFSWETWHLMRLMPGICYGN